MKFPTLLVSVFTLTILGVGLLFFAMIGLIFMLDVEREPMTTSYCDKIERIDGTLYCMAIMQAEDDNIKVLRGE